METKEHPTFLGHRTCWRWWQIIEKKKELYLASLCESHTIYPYGKKLEARCGFERKETISFARGQTSDYLPFFLAFFLISFIPPAFLVGLISLIVYLISLLLPIGPFVIWLFLVLLILAIASFLFAIILTICDFFSFRPKYCKQKTISPHDSDQCGIYGYTEQIYALTRHDITGCVSGSILGTVNFWGQVLHHEFGFRAQFAYPLSIEKARCSYCQQLISASSTMLEEKKHKGKLRLLAPICFSCAEQESRLKIIRDWTWPQELIKAYGLDKIPSGV